MTTSADDYVRKVISYMPLATPMRSQIAVELRSHIAERVSHGVPVEEVIRQLGDPAALADSYLSAETLVSANVWQRALAKMVDALLLLVVAVPLIAIWGQTLPREFLPFALLATFVTATALFGVYVMLGEAIYGQTIGKQLTGLHVVTEAGGRIGFGQAIVRQLPVFLQVFWIDVMFALFTDKNQRAFELLSKTRVVRATPLSENPAYNGAR